MICKQLEKCYEFSLSHKTIDNCGNDISQCIVFSDKRKHAKCEENKKKYTINNNNELFITLYKVDGGLITVDKTVPQGLSKCDYLFCIKESIDTAILVELKGTDVAKAIQQIYSTLNMYNSFLMSFKRILCRIIVTNSTPRINANPLYAKLQKEIKKKNGDIIIAERAKEETL